MRSKMLGLAIALVTFGIGVAATTVWIGYHLPKAVEVVPTVAVNALAPEPAVRVGDAEDSKPCSWDTRKDWKPISAGVLNSRALYKPLPAYPPIARTALASGKVVVQVLIDECGKAISARAISGHPLLRQAAVQATYKWRFAPGMLGGEPVKLSGSLTFDFLLQ